MFVKVRKFNVRKGEDGTVIYGDLLEDTVYNPLSAKLESVPPEEGKDIGEMSLLMDFGRVSRVLHFPWEDKEFVTEVYYMNENGKTVERYVY